MYYRVEERVSSKGKISYRTRVRMKGFPEQSATFKRKTDADRWGQKTASEMKEGKYFGTNEARKHTLSELINRYIETIIQKKTDSRKFKQNQIQQLEWWNKQIGAYRIGDITPALIAEYRDKISTPEKKLLNATINRYLAALSHVFTIAVNEWGWSGSNPLLKVTRMREAKGRTRYLSDEERQRLLNACKNYNNKILYTVVVLALSTGARFTELMTLKWEQIDIDRGVALLLKTKNGEIRNIYFSGLALELIKKLYDERDNESELVFHGSKKTMPMKIDKHWKKVIEIAQIKDFRFHDLRHSAASYLAMNGASSVEIAEVLGHKTLAMVKRYSHLSDGHTRKVVASMNEKIFG